MAKFCGNCGTKLRSRATSKEIKEEKSLEKDSTKEKPDKEILTDITEQQAHLAHLERQIQNIRIEIRDLNQEYIRCRQIRIREQTEVDELKKLSWRSLSARLSGSLQEKLKTEEMDVVRANAKENLVFKQLETLRGTLRNLEQEKRDYQNNISRARRMKLTDTRPKDQITQEKKQVSLHEDLDALLMGKYHLDKAVVLLDKAIVELQSVQNASTVDMVGDMTERSHVNNAERYVSNADSNLRQAKLSLSSVEDPDVKINLPSLVLDQFFDGLFQDFLTKQKIKVASNRCKQSRQEILDVADQVKASITKIKVMTGEVDKEISTSSLKRPEAISSPEEIPETLEEVTTPEMDSTIIEEVQKSEVDLKPQPPTDDISKPETKEQLQYFISEKYHADLLANKYRFKSLKFSDNYEKAITTFFSDKPQEMIWEGDAKKLVVSGKGRVSIDWNAKIEINLSPINKFNWRSPFEGINVICDSQKVQQRILETNRIGEKLRSDLTLIMVTINILEREFSTVLDFSALPSIRDTVDLVRDIILAIELVHI